MAGPHQDNGVPWVPKPPTTIPVSTGTSNFGPPGTGGSNQPPQVTTPVSTGTPNFGPPGTGGANQPPPTPIIDVKAEQEANEASYLNKIVSGTSGKTHQQLMDDRAKSAYDASKDRQQQVRDAIDLAKNLRDQGVTADQLTDEEKKQLTDLQYMQD